MNRPRTRLLRTGRIEIRMLVLFLVIAPALLIFLKIAAEVTAGDTLAYDRWLLLRLRESGNPALPVGPDWLARAMADFTALGGGAVLTFVTVMASGYLLARRMAALALFLALAIAAGGFLNSLLKYGFVRDRPDVVPHLVEVGSASFPSAHAMNSAMVYLTLAALLASAEKSWRVRTFLIGAALLLTLLIGFSRAWLGVHWPTDILAGWTVGAAWAVACSLAARSLQRRQAVEGPDKSPSAHARPGLQNRISDDPA